jgi:PAS domain S-box-containing protein
MRFNAITFKLLGFIVAAFMLTTIAVLILASQQLKRILDTSQAAFYSERIGVITGVLARYDERLQKTGLVEIYQDDFQESALETLRRTYYKTPDQTVYPYILDAKGVVIMHPILAMGDRSLSNNATTRNMLAVSGGTFESISQKEKKWYISRRFGPWGWMVGYALPLEDKYEAAVTFQTTLTTILVAVTLSVVLTLSLFVTHLTRPIILLTEASKQIAAGDLDQKIDLSGSDEVGVLARNFDNMRAAIQKQIIDLNNEIRDRKRAEQAQVETSHMLQLVMDNIPVRVFWKDRQSRYLGSNQPFADDAGRSGPGELIGKCDFDLPWTPDEAEAFRKDDRAVMESGLARFHFEETQTHMDGTTIWVRTSKIPMRDQTGKIIGVLGTYEDITLRKQADEELKKLRNYLSNIINSMPSILMGVDAAGTITQWNQEAQRRIGLSAEEAVGLPLGRAVPWLATEMARVGRAITIRQELRDLKRCRQEKGTIIFEDLTVYPLVANGVEGAVIRIDDVTERVRMEEMMIQSEKMLSVGGLAAGMAHEINNPLAGILQTANVLENRLSDTLALPANQQAAQAAGTTMAAIDAFMKARGIHEMLATIGESGRRVAAIVANMLSFARKENTQKSDQLLPKLIDKVLVLAATDYDMKKQYDFKRIELVKEYEDNLPRVPCEAAKIQQVLLNILRNGAQAMQSAGTARPCIVIRAYREKRRPMVCLEIEDNGPGMVEVERKRVFEPFFTTKPVGVGTGLGLSVSYFIVTEAHGGEMGVSSQPGQGSTFIIRLPLTVEV